MAEMATQTLTEMDYPTLKSMPLELIQTTLTLMVMVSRITPTLTLQILTMANTLTPMETVFQMLTTLILLNQDKALEMAEPTVVENPMLEERLKTHKVKDKDKDKGKVKDKVKDKANNKAKDKANNKASRAVCRRAVCRRAVRASPAEGAKDAS